MYLLEWAQGYIVLNSWTEVEKHPMYSVANIFQRTPLGWLA